MELSPEHQIVYSGGHHDVWCDKKTHLWGTSAPYPRDPRLTFWARREAPCDCAHIMINHVWGDVSRGGDPLWRCMYAKCGVVTDRREFVEG